jgi:hypothetical protein
LFESLLSRGIGQRRRLREKSIQLRRHLGADGFKTGRTFMQLRESGGAIDLRDDDFCRGGVGATAFQLIALRE